MTDAVRRFVLRLSATGGREMRGEIAQVGETGDRAFKRIVSGAEGASRALSLVGPVLSALATGALANFARRAVDAVGGLGELADQAGVSTDALQAFRFAALEVGLRSEELERGLAVLTRRIGEAAAGEQAGEQAFRRLGVAFTDTAGNARATEAVLADIADRIAGVESPAERARLAASAFGEDLGRRMIPFLAQGREGLERLTAEALRFGQIADAELIARADQASDRIARLSAAFSTLATNLAASVAPALSGIAETIGRVAFGVPVGEQIARLEARRADLVAARGAGGGVVWAQDAARRALEERGLARPERVTVEQIDRDLAELDRRLGELRQRGAQFEERAREIVEGRTRVGAGEAEARRERAAADIATLRETFDARVRIEREYQERLDRLRRAAEAGAVAPEERARLETAALAARNEALQRLTGTVRQAASAEQQRIDTLARQVEMAALVDERERFVAERLAGVSGVHRAEAERLAGTLFELQEARRAEAAGLQEAARLYEETRTPLERYVAALERLGELRPVLERRFGEARADEIIGRRAQTLLDELGRAEQQTAQVDDVARQLGLTFESAFESAIVRGQSFSDVLRGIEQDLLRLGTRKLVTEPLLALFNEALGGITGGGIGGLFSGLGSFLAGLFHDGGTVGASAVPKRRVPALAFAGAPRLHDGWFRPDEYPAILQRGEIVVPKRDARRALGPQSIVINVTTPDAESFRASQGQIAASMARSLQRAQRSL